MEITKMTIITIGSNQFTLTKQAYLDGDMYSAHATSQNGNEYMLHWEIISDSDDESNACDWDHPTFIAPL